MKRMIAVAALSAWVFACGLAGCGQTAESATDPELSAATSDALSATAGTAIARGGYLVNNVGMCGDCHTPMTPEGPDINRHLHGAPIPFVMQQPIPQWADFAPPIAGGFPGWTQAQLALFLQSGATPNGIPARPPMPMIRMNAEDAAAVAAYLHSLSFTPSN